MGNTILTPRQSRFLELATQEDEIIQWYYFTGGTALSEFYLHHRLSEDLDFFTTSPVNHQKTDAFIKKSLPVLGAIDSVKKNISGLYTYILTFSDGETLKIDFNEYIFPLIESSGQVFRGLRIDSFFDISVNKAYTISSRFQIRDFIDLFYILQREEFTLEQLCTRIPDKFGSRIDRANYSGQLLRVRDLPRAYPRMLVPFDFDVMVAYFTREAKRIAQSHLFNE